MATVNFIRNRRQSAVSLRKAMDYVKQEKKTFDTASRQRLISGINCSPDFTEREFKMTRAAYHKDSPVWFYHYTQSFSPEEEITGEKAHKIAKEFAERAWPDSQILIATHIDAHHIHSHFIVNSVCFESGYMLRQGPRTLEHLRKISDGLCIAHGLSVLPMDQPKRSSEPGTREYRSAVKGQSWKLRLMAIIDDCMARARSKRHFIEMMEAEGYQVKWAAERKSITYTTPSGMRCRDDRLHEEKYLKRRMEDEFRIRAALLAGGIETEEFPAAYVATMDSSAPANAEHSTEFGGAGQHAEPAGLPFGFYSDSGAAGENPGRTASDSSELTGWERERKILFSSETTFAEDPFQPVDPANPHTAGGILGDVLELGYAVEKSFPDVPINDSTTLPQRIDSAERRKTREKKLALGQKPDDQAVTHEQQM